MNPTPTTGAVLVLTPTARLARTESRRYAQAQVDAGCTTWIAPQVSHFAAWLAELRTAYLLATDDPRTPIDQSQARVIWQSLVDAQVFIGKPAVANLAERAWRRIHEHDLPAPETWPTLELSEDNRHFQGWAARFRQTCRDRGLEDEWSFAARVPALIASGLLPMPTEVRLVGFERSLPPLQTRILAALAACGTRVHQLPPASAGASLARVYAAPDATVELEAAAHWARTHLEAQPAARIAVVIPDLASRLNDVERIFRAELDPSGARLHQPRRSAWHISLGAPLLRWPLVADALTILELDERRIDQPTIRRLLRSPFLDGWPVEAPARELALAKLTRHAPWLLTLVELQRFLVDTEASQLAGRLTEFRDQRVDHGTRTWPSGWVARFQAELSALGFGTGRPLDSREYQVLKRWHDLLEAFSALDLVIERPIDRSWALALLRERAAAAVFREQDPGAPIEILGVEEALGARFDAIWLAALDRDQWPRAPDRDPLIPARLQQEIPGATAESALAEARATLAGLLATATEATGSFVIDPAEDHPQPTPLVADARVEALNSAAKVERMPLAEPIDDGLAPPFTGVATRGGTALLRQQSACPFRAFAEQRLGAVALDGPRPGLDAAERGQIIHQALEQLWAELADRASLAALSDGQRSALIDTAVDRAIGTLTSRYRLILSPAGIELERRRAHRLLDRWLVLELERPDFRVVAREQPIAMRFHGLALEGSIDRIDRLDDGGLLLIDYKTGASSRSSWNPDSRMAEPQLPAYAATLVPEPRAIAFARLKPDDLGFEGLAAEDYETYGIDAVAATTRTFGDIGDWPELMSRWRAKLDELAAEFVAGKAMVAPRHASVCTFCHLGALCRLRERVPDFESEVALDSEDDDE